MSLRMKKVNRLIKKELGEILLHDVKDPKIGFCTVTDVDVANDLRAAYVRVSVLGEKKQREITVKHLQKASGYIQKLLSSRVLLRYIPKLNFKLDTTIDHSLRITEIIEKIHEDEKKSVEENSTDQLDESR